MCVCCLLFFSCMGCMVNCEFVVFNNLPYSLVGAVTRVGQCVSSSVVAGFTAGCVMVLVE